MNISPQQKDILRDSGWVFISGGEFCETESARRTISLARSLGRPIHGRLKILERLKPTDPEKARRASLSRRFGRGPFPLHNDTAHWITPARYIVLTCLSPGAGLVPTLLLDTSCLKWTEYERSILQAGSFVVRNGRRSFYSSILGLRRSFIRYDPGCMEPEGTTGKDALEIFSEECARCTKTEVKWSPGSSLVIDNWRVLHGRGSVKHTASDRLLIRSLVS
jgi:hypothetical protein